MQDTVREDGAPHVPPPVTPVPTTHSKIGIASFVVAVGMFLAFLVGILYFNLSWQSDAQRPWFATDLMFAWQLFVVLFLPIPAHIIGFVLGCVSFFFPTRKKLFPLLGMILNLGCGVLSLFPWLYMAWLGLHTGVK